MNYLLDTHTLIWAMAAPHKLSKKVADILQDANDEIFVSVISFWEIALKCALHKIQIEGLEPEDFLKAAIKTGFQVISLEAQTSVSYHQLKANHHRDPFDRMLIWLAIQNDYQLISKDEDIQKYADVGLNVIW